jgi:hypothetical protein
MSRDECCTEILVHNTAQNHVIIAAPEMSQVSSRLSEIIDAEFTYLQKTMRKALPAFAEILLIPLSLHQASAPQPQPVYFSGIKRDECVAPIPGLPCFTGL